MGTQSSKQQIGEKVKASIKHLKDSGESEEQQYERISKMTPQTLQDMVENIEKALKSYAPFPATTLVLAFKADQKRVKKALTECCQKVLTAPIQKERYQWFMQYVFKSSVWFKKMESGKYLYRELMEITNFKQETIIQNMDAVYDHLQSHRKWKDIESIQNLTVVSRQDDDTVGLLKESGIRDIDESKDSDDGVVDIDDLKNFIDNNLAVNILMTTAKAIDHEFQKEMNTILSRHGDFKPGPMKKVERALSKMENDYMDEEYPTAAKLLDIVRCSVGYNTAGQLLEGYTAFMDHIGSGVSSMTVARVKNGFLDEGDGGYRDIKVNVVYHSTLNPDLKMICEVQFILNQYLYEKKRVHKLYSIARESAFFEMVVREMDDAVDRGPNLKTLKFEPILNVRDDVEMNHENEKFFKSSIEPDLGLLGMNGRRNGVGMGGGTKFFCINMETKKVIFEKLSKGRHSHHWITINDQKYLSLQTTKNTICYFRVSDDHQLEEDESMKITLSDDDEINNCEYDQSFEYLYTVRNSSILEKRAITNLDTVVISIKLEHNIGSSKAKLLTLSNDGKFCAIAAGTENFIHIVSLETQEQFRLISQNLGACKAPCWINGDSQQLAIGSDGGGMEIWSVTDREMLHHFKYDCQIWSFYSVNGILAVGLRDKGLQLYDVSSWTKIYRFDMEIWTLSLFLTPDLKYLAAGCPGAKCVVLEIQ